MLTIRILAKQNVWAPLNHMRRLDSPDVEWLETLESLAPQPAVPPWRPVRSQVPERENPTTWGPDQEL